MILTLLNWIYVIVTCYLAGSFALRRIYGQQIRVASSVMAGFCILTAYAGYFSLIYKVGIVANVIMLIMCLIMVIIDRRKLKEEWSILINDLHIDGIMIVKIVLSVLIVLVTLYYSSYGKFAYDTGLYHAQSIRWIEEYGVVKGLAYMQTRLGFNSSYFCLCALYSFHEIGNSMHALSGFLAVFTMLYAIWGYDFKAVRISSFLRLAPFAYFIIIANELISPTTDFVTIFLIIWICIRWFEIKEESPDFTEGYALLCVMAVFLVSVKLSVGVLALLALMPGIKLIKAKDWKHIFLYIGCGVVLILPYFIRNVLITGWLIYPFPSIDLFNVDWKINKTGVQYEADEIVVWARYTRDVALIDQSISEWFPVWWDEQGAANRFLSISAFLSATVLGLRCVLAVVRAIIARIGKSLKCLQSLCDDAEYIGFVIIFLINFAFFFLSAPSNRFGYAYILVIVLLAVGDMAVNIVPIICDCLEKIFKEYKYYTVLKVAVSLAVCLMLSKGMLKGLYYNAYDDLHYAMENVSSDYLVVPKDYPRTQVSHKSWEGIEIYYPVIEGEQIWYHDFPATLYEGNLEGIERRGTHIQDGFRLRY